MILHKLGLKMCPGFSPTQKEASVWLALFGPETQCLNAATFSCGLHTMANMQFIRFVVTENMQDTRNVKISRSVDHLYFRGKYR